MKNWSQAPILVARSSKENWRVIDKLKTINAELLEACKEMLKIYYDTNVSYRHEHEKEVAQKCEQAIAKAEKEEVK